MELQADSVIKLSQRKRDGGVAWLASASGPTSLPLTRIWSFTP